MANRGSLDFGGKNSGIGADNRVSWSEAKFLSTVPSFLQNDADILRLAEETRFEEERRKRLEEEGEQRSSQPMVAGQGATDIASPTQGQASA